MNPYLPRGAHIVAMRRSAGGPECCACLEKSIESPLAHSILRFGYMDVSMFQYTINPGIVGS